MAESEPLTYNVDQVAKLLRLGRGTTYEQIRQGAIPSIRFGRRLLVPKAALDKLLAEAGNGK